MESTESASLIEVERGCTTGLETGQGGEKDPLTHTPLVLLLHDLCLGPRMFDLALPPGSPRAP